MKKIFYVLYYALIFIFLQNQYVFCETNFTIWEPHEEKLYKKFNEKGEINLEDRQKVIDGSVEQKFNYNLTYTNLQECLIIALANNFNIKIEKRKKESTKWEYRAKLSEFLPNIYNDFAISSIQGEYLVGDILPVRINEVPIQNHYGITWSTYNQGRTIFESQAKKTEYKAQDHRVKYKIDEVIFNVAVAYYDLLQTKLEIEILRINEHETLEQLNYTKALYEIGMGTKYDVLRAEVEHTQAQQNLIIALKNIRLKQARLANIMGIDVFTSIYPSELLIDTVQLVDKSLPLEKYFQRALCVREDIRAKREDIKALEAKKNSLFTEFLPNVILQYDRADVGTAKIGLRHNDTLYLNVRWELGKNLGVNTITLIKAYEAQIEAAKLELEAMERSIKESILNGKYESDAYLNQIEYAKKEMEAADEALRISMARMSIGEATFLDVLSSQKNKTQARTALIANIINYNKNEVKFLFDLGDINIDNVLLNYIIPPNPLCP